MKLLIYTPDGKPEPWVDGFAAALPNAHVRAWQPGDQDAADYAVAWTPHAEMLCAPRGLKALFNLGAGVDGVLRLGDALPRNLPLIRLDDAGMARQMGEYVLAAVLRQFRQLDRFAQQQGERQWRFCKPHRREDFTLGVMGLGVLGSHVARLLASHGFPVRGWSRSAKQIGGVQCYTRDAQLQAFLEGTRVLVNLLPLTPGTADILNRSTMQHLPPGAYLINVGRGAHLVDDDLIALLDSGHLSGATLDVFRIEPLPADHPFWHHPRITITPHISALTLREDSIEQIVAKLRMLEAGLPVSALQGYVDRERGY